MFHFPWSLLHSSDSTFCLHSIHGSTYSILHTSALFTLFCSPFHHSPLYSYTPLLHPILSNLHHTPLMILSFLFPVSSCQTSYFMWCVLKSVQLVHPTPFMVFCSPLSSLHTPCLIVYDLFPVAHTLFTDFSFAYTVYHTEHCSQVVHAILHSLCSVIHATP